MLIGNGRLIDKIPMSFLGRDGLNNLQPGIAVASTWAANFGALAAIPDGYYTPHGWLLPRKAGALRAGGISGTGGATALAQSGYNIDASIAGAGGIPGCDLGLIVSIAATLIASGGISSAQVDALASMVAIITGSGDITATGAGLADLGAALLGSGAVSATNTALMDIAATVVGYGELTPEGLRDAVWNAVLESGYSSSDILRLIAAATQGSATGLEDGSPVFKGLDGATDRITATYSSGTRTVTARDAT